MERGSSRFREPLGQVIALRLLDLSGLSNDCPSLRIKVGLAPSQQCSLALITKLPLKEKIRLTTRGELEKRVFSFDSPVNDNHAQCLEVSNDMGSKLEIVKNVPIPKNHFTYINWE